MLSLIPSSEGFRGSLELLPAPLTPHSAKRQQGADKQPGRQQHWIAAGLRRQLLLETDRENKTFFFSPLAVLCGQWADATTPPSLVLPRGTGKIQALLWAGQT